MDAREDPRCLLPDRPPGEDPPVGRSIPGPGPTGPRGPARDPRGPRKDAPGCSDASGARAAPVAAGAPSEPSGFEVPSGETRPVLRSLFAGPDVTREGRRRGG